MEYKLRFDRDARLIGDLARRYTSEQKQKDQEAEAYIENGVVLNVQQTGYYTKSDFLKLCEWKTPRTKPLCGQNDERFIVDVTTLALKTENEQLRIEVLTLMEGVGWPTASVLLHFGYQPKRYPILDYRALWSLSIPQPNEYSFPFWQAYVELCRNLADECNVAMRTLDRALWQYSTENQS
jgi:hypothetical protein